MDEFKFVMSYDVETNVYTRKIRMTIFESDTRIVQIFELYYIGKIWKMDMKFIDK